MKKYFRGMVPVISLLLLLGSAGCWQNPSNARSQLAQMNISFSPEDFVRQSAIGYIVAVRLFLEAGIDINARSKSGMTALMFAADEGHYEIVKLLLEKGADANVQEQGWTALIFAANKGRTDIAKLLIEKGANIHAKDKEGSTPLIFAADKGMMPVVSLLLEKGADINAQGKDGATALMNAAILEQTDIAKLLIDKGADLNVQDKNGWTALMLAGENRVSKLLIEKGARR